MNEYYVYIYLDPRKPGVYIYDDIILEYEPFYVGKGKGKRMNDHRKRVYNNFKEGCNLFKIRKIKAILSKGLEPIQIMYVNNLLEIDAFNLETEIIRKIGRIDIGTGPLCNFTNGGEGASGLIHKSESKEKLSKTLKEKYANGEMTTWNKELVGCHSPETITKIRLNVSKATLGKKKVYTEEGKKALSESVSNRIKGSKLSEAHKEGIRLGWIKRKEREKVDKEQGIIKPKRKGKMGKMPWNKGLTKNDPRVAKQGWKGEDKDKMREITSKTFKGRKKSKEQIEKYKETVKSKKLI